MQIKYIKNSDVKELSTLAYDIWCECYRDILGINQINYMTDKYLSQSAIVVNINDGYKYAFILENGKNIGFIAYQIRKESLFLSKFYLLKDYRGKGYFKQGFTHLIDVAKQHNKTKITLTVNRYNDNAIGVYKSIGFNIISQADVDIGNGYFMNDFNCEYVIKKFE